MSTGSNHLSFKKGVRSLAVALGLGGILLPAAVQAIPSISVDADIISPSRVAVGRTFTVTFSVSASANGFNEQEGSEDEPITVELDDSTFSISFDDSEVESGPVSGGTFTFHSNNSHSFGREVVTLHPSETGIYRYTLSGAGASDDSSTVVVRRIPEPATLMLLGLGALGLLGFRGNGTYTNRT